jgi:hypothetical protein
MIDNPKYGWCHFQIGDFSRTVSYLTDVPLDLLEAFTYLYNKGAGAVYFDEEGNDFTLLLTPNSVYIVEEQFIPVLHKFDNIDTNELTRELIADIEKDFIRWGTEFSPSDNDNDIKNHLNEIDDALFCLKTFYERTLR